MLQILFVGDRAMSEEARHIVCPNCKSVNRIPSEKNPRKAKCGHCHQPLFTGRPVPASANSFATHIQAKRHPGAGRLLGAVVRALQSDGAGL
jgi:hypothetical protein